MDKTSSDAGQIPDKKYFRIGEVSKFVGVDPHVLRFWETEFKIIRPHRAKSKQRLYRKKDVENLLRIKVLLHDEGYTISGARKVLKTGIENVPVQVAGTRQQLPTGKLAVIKDELRSIMDEFNLGGKKQSKG